MNKKTTIKDLDYYLSALEESMKVGDELELLNDFTALKEEVRTIVAGMIIMREMTDIYRDYITLERKGSGVFSKSIFTLEEDISMEEVEQDYKCPLDGLKNQFVGVDKYLRVYEGKSMNEVKAIVTSYANSKSFSSYLQGSDEDVLYDNITEAIKKRLEKEEE